MTDAHHRRNVPLTVLAAALAFGTGAMDVVSFTRLGGMFSSVMTGNLVLLGLAAARPSVRPVSWPRIRHWPSPATSPATASAPGLLGHHAHGADVARRCHPDTGGGARGLGTTVSTTYLTGTLTVVIATATIIHTAAKPHVGTP